MISSSRQVAFDCLCRIELQHHSDDVLNSAAVAQLEPRDRNLVTEITYGTLRWRGWLDSILQSAVTRGWDQVDFKARILLRLSLYQMARMDRMPDHALINDAVELAKKHLRPGASGFTNGVLRNLARQRPWLKPEFHRDSPMWVRASLPQWLWERWQERFGTDRAFEYALSLNHPPQVAFRLAHGSAVPEDIEARPSDLVPGAWITPQSISGRVAAVADLHIQDEASQLIPHLLGEVRGHRLWDACAAPGGKTLILIERCGSQGHVLPSDISEPRARALMQWLQRVGPPPDVMVADARAPLPFRTEFDGVMADVPCSGLGTLRRNPEIKWRLDAGRLGEYGARQREILNSVSTAVRPRGALLYSTCSTEPEENEDVVRGFLAEHPQFELVRPGYPAGIDEWLDPEGFFRSFPSPRRWDSFFAALMTRRC